MTLAALVMRSVAQSWRLIVGVLALVGGFQIVLVVVARSLELTASFTLLMSMAPGFVQQALGTALPLVASFQGLLTVGYFHPLMVMVLSQFAIFLATEPAHEVEQELVDLLLARPLARHWLITRSLVVMLGGSAAGAAAMMGGTWTGLALFAPPGVDWPPFSRVAAMTWNLLAAAWCAGTIGLLAGAAAARRGSAFALVGIGAVLLYLVEFVGQSWAPAALVARVSPFHYYRGTDFMLGTASVGPNVTILLGAATLVTLAAYAVFARRDV